MGPGQTGNFQGVEDLVGGVTSGLGCISVVFQLLPSIFVLAKPGWEHSLKMWVYFARDADNSCAWATRGMLQCQLPKIPSLPGVPVFPRGEEFLVLAGILCTSRLLIFHVETDCNLIFGEFGRDPCASRPPVPLRSRDIG